MADTRKDLDTALQVYQGLAEDVAGIIDELPPDDTDRVGRVHTATLAVALCGYGLTTR